MKAIKNQAFKKSKSFIKWEQERDARNENSKGIGFWWDDAFDRAKSTLAIKNTDKKNSHVVRDRSIYEQYTILKSISNFVKIVSGKNVPVRYSTSSVSQTDGKTVQISANAITNFESVCGLAMHEASHIKYTNFEFLNNFMADYRALRGGDHADKLKLIINFIEDRRIDSLVFHSSPGYKNYYHKLYAKYFYQPDLVNTLMRSDKYNTETWESYSTRIFSLMYDNANLKVLAELETIAKLIDLPNITRLSGIEEVIELSEKVYDIIENAILKPKQKLAEDKNSKSEPKKSDKPKSDDTADSSDDESTESNDDEEMKLDEEGDDSSSDSSDDESDNSDESTDESNDNESSDDDSNDSGDDASGDSSSDSDGNNNVTDESTDSEPEPAKIEEIKINETKAEEAIKISKKLVLGSTDIAAVDRMTSDILDQISADEFNMDIIEYDKYKLPILSVDLSNKLVNTYMSGTVEDKVLEYVLSPNSDRMLANAAIISKGVSLGIQLGKKLSLVDEVRSTEFLRLKTGKISGRLLNQAGYDNMNIFYQEFIDKHIPTNIHISVDASGSMGGSKWTQTQTAVIAIVKACSMVQNVSVQVSYRTTNSDGPILVNAYDSKKNSVNDFLNYCKYLYPMGSTPDSLVLAYQLKRNELKEGSSEFKSYFINFSDGAPMASFKPVNAGEIVKTRRGRRLNLGVKSISYGGQPALAHTKMVRKKIENLGIQVMSFFITEGNKEIAYRNDNFIDTWGSKNAKVISVSDLLPLSNSINEMLLK